MALVERLAPAYVVTPPEITTPIVQVHRSGGHDNGVTDHPRVQISCLALTRHEAWQLAEQVRQVVLNAGGTTADGALIDRAGVEVAPQQVPDEDPHVRRVVATYVLTMRRPIS